MAKKGMPVAEALEHLGLTTEATEADVKQSYKDLARIWHPDRFQSDPRLEAKAEEQIKVINEARSVALKYVKKHGHFRFVGQQRGKRPTPQPPPRPEPQAKPRPEPEPKPKRPKQEPPKAKKAERPKQDAPPKREQPPPRPEPEYEPVYDDDEEYDDYTDHMPGQNIIIAGVLLVVLVGFVFLMMSTMKDSRKDKVEAYLKQREEMKKNPKKRAPIIIEEEPVEEEEKSSDEDMAYTDTFFTLGSTKEWVSLVQGAPFQIKGDVWKYGFSTVTFRGDAVIGWKSSELHPLSVGMLQDPDEENIQHIFGIGASKKEVAIIYGAPDIVNGDLWTYGEAYVRFKGDTIVFWQNDQHNTFDVEFDDNVKHMRIYITPEETFADTIAAP